MRKPGAQTIFLGSVIAGVLVLTIYLSVSRSSGQAGNRRGAVSSLTLRDIPFNGERSFQYLKDLCELGPRPSGSAAMARQQRLLNEHFTRLGGRVSMQQFDTRHPLDGSRVTMSNVIVEWHPQRNERILLCAHYDTRPYPDEDPRRPRGIFIGANDGASGTALLMELAHHMPDLESRFGVDFVLFDGEEFVFDNRRDPYFLGSEYFAKSYVAQPPAYRYRYGVLLDMVADAHLEIYMERNSVRYARALVDQIWETARTLGVRDFIPRTRHEIRDDHLALNLIAGIPSCDIIDFDYPRPGFGPSYWHTEADTPENCSALSLAKVGWVVHEWLRRAN